MVLASPDANGDFNRFSRFRDYDATYQVFRAELSGSVETAGLKHRLVLGVDADEFENDQFARRDRTTPQIVNVFNPVYGEATIEDLVNLAVQIDRVETQETVGVYFQDQISITEAFDLRVGARFDDYDQELLNLRSNKVSKYSETRVSPQIGGVYNASEAISFYAVYGENFRPLSGATDDNNLEPNQSESIELGINFTLKEGVLNGSLAFFDVDQSNISTVDEDFNATAIGEAGSQGVELDLYGYITDNLSLWLSYAYVNAETKNDFNDPNFGTVVPAGSDLLNIPENQLSLHVVHQSQLAGKDLSLIGGLTFVDDRNGFFSKQEFRLPSYTTVRIAARYEVSENLELRAEVNNLFDEEYYTNSFADVWVQPGSPRNVNFSATYKF